MALSVALLLVAKTSPLDAQVSNVPPFIGTYSETWEEFGQTEIPSGTSILGGIATISGDHIVTEGSFQMCSVRGQPSDGKLLMDSDRPTGPLIISFSQPVSAFGAYWGSGGGCPRCCGFADAPSILTFKDVNGNIIGTDSFSYRGDGPLMWRGYRFATPVKTIVRVAGDNTEGVAIDGLQATVATLGVNPAQFQNISTRLAAGTGDNVPIAGFILTGTDGKKVLVRAIGPSLPVGGTLADPMLELHDSSGATIGTNDNWKDTQQVEINATGIPPANDLESALVRTLAANNSAYTAVVRGKGGGIGIALVEVYDLDGSATSQLANISTRGLVGTADNVMIEGLIVGPRGADAARLLVRAIGPSLAASRITGALQDTYLELHNQNGELVATNDNWRDTQAADIQATGLAPLEPRESAILTQLSPGAATAVVRGVNNTTGVALVEAYRLQ